MSLITVKNPNRNTLTEPKSGRYLEPVYGRDKGGFLERGAEFKFTAGLSWVQGMIATLDPTTGALVKAGVASKTVFPVIRGENYNDAAGDSITIGSLNVPYYYDSSTGDSGALGKFTPTVGLELTVEAGYLRPAVATEKVFFVVSNKSAFTSGTVSDVQIYGNSSEAPVSKIIIEPVAPYTK